MREDIRELEEDIAQLRERAKREEIDTANESTWRTVHVLDTVLNCVRNLAAQIDALERRVEGRDR